MKDKVIPKITGERVTITVTTRKGARSYIKKRDYYLRDCDILVKIKRDGSITCERLA